MKRERIIRIIAGTFVTILLAFTLVCVGCTPPPPPLFGTPETHGLVVIAIDVRIVEGFFSDPLSAILLGGKKHKATVTIVDVREVGADSINRSDGILYSSLGGLKHGPSMLVLLSDLRPGQYRLKRIIAEYTTETEEESDVFDADPIVTFENVSYQFHVPRYEPEELTFSVYPGSVTYVGKLEIRAREGQLEYWGSAVYSLKYDRGFEMKALKKLLKSYKKSEWRKPIRDRLEALERAKHHE